MRKILLYIAFALLAAGLIIPAYLTRTIVFDIGDIINWSWGLQVIISRDLEMELVLIHFSPDIIPWITTLIGMSLLIILLIETIRIDYDNKSLYIYIHLLSYLLE